MMLAEDMCISGVVTALSHIFNTKPRAYLVELQNKDGIYFIHVKNEAQFCWEANVEIGCYYSFTNVCETYIHCEGKRVTTFVPTEVCECILRTNVSIPNILHFNFALKNYKGKVTHIEPLLSMYELDNKVELCLAFLDTRTSCPSLGVGQEITIYNAHIVTSKEDKKCLVLCGRSYIKCHTAVEVDSSDDESTPLATAVAHSRFGYQDFLRFKKIITEFQEKFNDDFLTAVGAEDPQIIRSEVFVQTMRNLSYAEKYNNEVLINEFVSSPHSCIVSLEAHFIPELLTVEDCVNLLNKNSEVNPSAFWFHKVVPQSDNESILVGYLAVSAQTGSWVLSDGTRKLNCIISGCSDKLPVVSALLQLNKKIVLIKQYNVILEEFQVNKENIPKVVKKVYLHFTIRDICCLSDPKLVVEDPLPLKLDLDTFCNPPNQQSSLQLYSNIQNSDIILDFDNLLSSKNDKSKSNHKQLNIQTVLLHQVSNIMKDCKDSPPECCLLVSLIDKISQELDDATSSDSTAKTAKRYIVIIKGQLLRLRPFCIAGNIYRIILPTGYHFEELSKGSRGNSFCNVLPHSGVVVLPKGSNIHLVQQSLPHVTFNQDWYSISGLQDIQHSEIINVEGYVYDRLHLSPNHTTELRNLNLTDYGIPDMKNAVLKLKDANGIDTVCLYISNWANHLYPLGMLIGAHICATFVKKIATNNSYLVCTSMTNIHILSLSSYCDNSRLSVQDIDTILQLDQPLVYGSTFWTILCPDDFQLMLNVVCSHCHSRIANNQCTFKGCMSRGSIAIEAKATCLLREMLGKAVIHLQDEHVRIFLGIPIHIWEILNEHFRQTGTSFIQDSEKDEGGNSMVEEVLQLYCEVAPQQRRFHVLCRVMKTDNPGERSGSSEDSQTVPRLFCLDIQEATSDMSHRLCQVLSVQQNVK